MFIECIAIEAGSGGTLFFLYLSLEREVPKVQGQMIFSTFAHLPLLGFGTADFSTAIP